MNPADEARALAIRKQSIEAEIEAQLSILSANSVTFRSPLVDPEGFPRSDIDIFAVRGARVRIIELRNDLKAVVDDLAKALEVVYDKRSTTVDTSGSVSNVEEEVPLQPFARVDGVAPNSPASAAVSVEEYIIRFLRN